MAGSRWLTVWLAAGLAVVVAGCVPASTPPPAAPPPSARATWPYGSVPVKFGEPFTAARTTFTVRPDPSEPGRLLVSYRKPRGVGGTAAGRFGSPIAVGPVQLVFWPYDPYDPLAGETVGVTVTMKGIPVSVETVGHPDPAVGPGSASSAASSSSMPPGDVG